MPDDKDVIAMILALWNEWTSPHPWQINECNTMKEKITEVEKRIGLVGPIHRLVIESSLFEVEIEEFPHGATEASEKVSGSDL